MKRRVAIERITGGLALAAFPRVARAAELLRAALLPVDPAASIYYAQDQGFFGEVAIEPQIQVIQAGSAVVSAVLANAIDVGWSNPISIAAARLRGLPLSCIAAGGVYVEHEVTAGILVPKNSPAKTARDLNNKTMGVSGLQTLGQWGPAAWIDKNGGDSRTIKWVEMPFPDMPLALAQERVDAAYAAEPFITLSKEGRVFADAFAAIAPRFTIGAWVTTQEYADAHRDLIARFARAMAKAATWGNEHRDQSAAILSKYSKLDPAVTKSMVRVTYATRLLAVEMQPVIDLAVHYGTLRSSIRASDLVYKL
jgi:NitT/TauT family transport system substrate-binding protein